VVLQVEEAKSNPTKTVDSQLRHRGFLTYASIFFILILPSLNHADNTRLRFASHEKTLDVIKPENQNLLTLEQKISKKTIFQLKSDLNLSKNKNTTISTLQVGLGIKERLSKNWTLQVYYYPAFNYGAIEANPSTNSLQFNSITSENDSCVLGLAYSF
jgi:predicted transcriptional regulator